MKVGTYAVDARNGKVGRVMAREGGFVQLRPPGGGVEWDCPPEVLTAVEAGEALRGLVREVNQERRLP
ncbi:hypothetical protein [Streptomyces sp. NBC_01465]|uniref:hypothetical protein n=1 Tax=Streptomyces sp. NBC_01465 TaxID=2903878 RepID=UPI002E32E730|nr:hypothetical protein [Streptomyces sp. NBC_01465]